MLGLHSTLLSVHTDYLWHVIYHMRVSLLQPELHSESSLVREQSCDKGGRVKSSHVIQRQTERYPHTERCTSHVKGCIWVCSHSWSHSPPRPNKSDKQRLLKQCCIWHSRCQMAALCSHNLFTPSHASHAALPPQPCCPPTDDQSQPSTSLSIQLCSWTAQGDHTTLSIGVGRALSIHISCTVFQIIMTTI